jgi:hypothetical protein
MQDIKADIKFGVFERATWKRTAVVTDLGWVRRAMELPGLDRAWGAEAVALEQIDDAKAWVAG